MQADYVRPGCRNLHGIELSDHNQGKAKACNASLCGIKLGKETTPWVCERTRKTRSGKNKQLQVGSETRKKSSVRVNPVTE
jgi:hypothetical protein